MKITNIEKNGDDFTVTSTPNWIQENIFRIKEKNVKYKNLNTKYANFSYYTAFRKENGDIVDAYHDEKLIKALNRELNKF